MTSLAERLGAVMALDREAPALEFEGRWWTWGDLSSTAAEVDRLLAGVDLGAGAPVGLMLRNRPVALGAFLGLLRAGACVVTVNPLLGAERLRVDLPTLGLPLLIGEPDDLALLPPDVLPSTARGMLGPLGAPIEHRLHHAEHPAHVHEGRVDDHDALAQSHLVAGAGLVVLRAAHDQFEHLVAQVDPLGRTGGAAGEHAHRDARRRTAGRAPVRCRRALDGRPEGPEHASRGRGQDVRQ